tara:strand:- start:665 stop:1297 length:633 start_codon:yes stop_codon:yes gene_type:complete
LFTIYNPGEVAILRLVGLGILGAFTYMIIADTHPQSDPQLATFAGGCFWCMESPYDDLEGVISTVVGYSGGHVENPSYEAVSSGQTGHLEVIQITYDPDKINYTSLLDVFWRNIDPTNDQGQFSDFGSHYLTAIFYHNEQQKEAALASKTALANSGKFDKPIVTDIRKATVFYKAEEHHQDFYKNHPLRYNRYKYGSGRPQFLKKIWGKD